jgi:hypothetical protein
MATGRVPTTANSPLTAKGDLFGYSTAPARLAVGNDGEQIVADSSTSTGLRYTAGTVQSNPVINSAMQIWQRGTSFTPTGATTVYTADRWGARSTNGGQTVSRQTVSDSTNLPNIQYCIRVQRNSGSIVTNGQYLSQSFETVNSIPYAGKTVTLSFYARKGANLSGTFTAELGTGTGTDQEYTSAGYTGSATPIIQTPTLTTTWQRFSYSATLSSTMTEMAIQFSFSPSGTAGAADYFEVTGVQVDIGSVALPFRTYAGTIQGELAACQRYYERLTAAQVYEHFGVAQPSSTTSALATVYFKVSKRSGVSATVDYSTLGLYDTAAIQAISSLSMSFAGINSATVTCVSSGLTAQRFYQIMANNSTSAYIGFSAEL